MSAEEDAEFPTVTVITVTYNAEKTIEDTFHSVINQSYPNYDYLIIDGLSTDSTCELIRELIAQCSKKIEITLISERDSGIYDAMNKACRIAKGQWLCFMNSGDTYCGNDVIREVFEKASNKDSSVLYGDVLRQYPNGSELLSCKDIPITTIERYLFFCHQASFVSAEVARKYRFDQEYRICADDDFFLRVYRDGLVFEYIPVCVANYDVSGVSNSSYSQTILEHFEIRKKYGYERRSGFAIALSAVRLRIAHILNRFSLLRRMKKQLKKK